MHGRSKDAWDVVHYVDTVWYQELNMYLFAPWCEMTQARLKPPSTACLANVTRSRSAVVTCVQCLALRWGPRAGA